MQHVAFIYQKKSYVYKAPHKHQSPLMLSSIDRRKCLKTGAASEKEVCAEKKSMSEGGKKETCEKVAAAARQISAVDAPEVCMGDDL